MGISYGFRVSHCRFARRACRRSTYCNEEPEARGRDCVDLKRVTYPLKRGAVSKRGLSTHCKVGGAECEQRNQRGDRPLLSCGRGKGPG